MNLVNWYVPSPFDQGAQYGFIQTDLVKGAMIVAAILPLAALLRIATSRGTRRGVALATCALLISAFWWGVMLYFSIVFHNFGNTG